jgi:transposase InsO family protein
MTADLKDPDLAPRLGEWQFFYNWQRPHSSIGGSTPMERCGELTGQTPLSEEAYASMSQRKGRSMSGITGRNFNSES